MEILSILFLFLVGSLAASSACFILFETQALAHWIIKLSSYFSEKQKEIILAKTKLNMFDPDSDQNYFDFLREMNESKNFLIKILTCPDCFSFWLCFFFCLTFSPIFVFLVFSFLFQLGINSILCLICALLIMPLFLLCVYIFNVFFYRLVLKINP